MICVSSLQSAPLSVTSPSASAARISARLVMLFEPGTVISARTGLVERDDFDEVRQSHGPEDSGWRRPVRSRKLRSEAHSGDSAAPQVTNGRGAVWRWRKSFDRRRRRPRCRAAWKFFKSVSKRIQRAREILAVGQRDVAPHFRRAGRDARGVAKTGRAQRRLVCGLAGFKTRFASAAATTCGRWLERLTSKSCCAASSRSVRAPSACQNASSLRTAPALDFLSGVTTQTAFAYKSARAASTPIFSPPAIGWLPTKCAPDFCTSDASSRTTRLSRCRHR